MDFGICNSKQILKTVQGSFFSEFEYIFTWIKRVRLGLVGE